MALPARYIQGDETPKQALTRMSEGTWQMGSASNGSDEVQTAAFSIGLSDVPDKRHRWRSHADRTIEGHRKQDVILVSESDSSAKPNTFSSILACCKVKQTTNPTQANVTQQLRKTQEQLMDMASRVISVQKGRRFFVGLGLCNSELIVALFVRGCTVFTPSVNIHAEPLTFLHILLTVTDASPTWLGFDPRLNLEKNIVTINGEYKITRTLSRSLGMAGRGTVVYLLELPGDPPCYFALERSMEHADIAPFKTKEDENLFGEPDVLELFKHCIPASDAAAWDYDRKLPGLPIVEHVAIPVFDLPDHSEVQDNKKRYKEKIREDTTAHNVSRIAVNPGGILFRTVGIPITMFSCRRELLNALMCTAAALFNGLRMSILHCDMSQNNLMLCVREIDEEDIIPDWPDSPSEGSHPGRSRYPKRAGLLDDWGLGLPFPNEPLNESRESFATGTFIATELLTNHGLGGHVAHQPHHDLELLFWVLWVISINYEGPYGKQRTWRTHDGRVLHGSSLQPHKTRRSTRANTHSNPLTLGQYIETTATSSEGIHRYADDTDGFTAMAPVWATPETHHTPFQDIYYWKVGALISPHKSLIRPISSYFKRGPGGEAFVEGILKLAERFKWDTTGPRDSPPETPITHAEFCHIVAQMRDAIDSNDKPTEDDVERARLSFRKKMALQADNFEDVFDLDSESDVRASQ